MHLGDDNCLLPCWWLRGRCVVFLVRCTPGLPFYVRYRSVTCDILVSAAGIFSWCLLHAVLVPGVPFCCCGAHKSLAPIAGTLLSVFGHATFSFAVLAALMFIIFCLCFTIFDLAKPRRKIFRRVSEVGKKIFSFMFSNCASFSWYFCLWRSRATPSVLLEWRDGFLDDHRI